MKIFGRDEEKSWIIFEDRRTGGYFKTKWRYILVEAAIKMAVKIFKRRFDVDPDAESCSCCWEDYHIRKGETLLEASREPRFSSGGYMTVAEFEGRADVLVMRRPRFEVPKEKISQEAEPNLFGFCIRRTTLYEHNYQMAVQRFGWCDPPRDVAENEQDGGMLVTIGGLPESRKIEVRGGEFGGPNGNKALAEFQQRLDADVEFRQAFTDAGAVSRSDYGHGYVAIDRDDGKFVVPLSDWDKKSHLGMGCELIPIPPPLTGEEE